MPRFLKKANSIATVSTFSKSDLLTHYPLNESRISIVYNGVRESFGQTSNHRELTKIKYTGGTEYFIYVGAIQPRKNLVSLLKAFSIFKKRQQSNMKLVFAGRLAWKNEVFLSLLKTYKYRNDIVLTDYLKDQELAQIMSAAYALVYPSVFEGFGVPVLEAMKSGIPVITSADSSMQEVAGDAGLYFNPHDHLDMADKMMRIYKDESLRSRLIQIGSARAAQFSWQKTADLLWESMMKAMIAGDV